MELVAGKPISDIFVDDGESAFRELERAAVAAALDEHDGVLALGGGAVLDAARGAGSPGTTSSSSTSDWPTPRRGPE